MDAGQKDTSGAETIFALSTPPGRGGVAVVRLSGSRAGAALEALSGKALPEARRASLRRLSDPVTGAWLDEALVLFFAAPGSFTGEDVVELHLHGGRAVVEAVLTALGQIEGLRPAEPGAFTRRAFENGRLDLTEVEGLADLIEAETAAQREQALRQMSGSLSARAEGWRSALIRAMAYIEAEIDFGEEEGDVGEGLSLRVLPLVAEAAADMEEVLSAGYRGELVREGLEIAIVGPPNAGKSSLLNWLAGRDAAIVSEEAGTTRDVIEVRLDMEGVPVTLCDTAGLREAASAVEAEGIRRALARAAEADFRIVIASVAPDLQILGSFEDAAPDDVCVLNKVDLLDSGAEQAKGHLGDKAVDGALPVSVSSGAGLRSLEELIRGRVRTLLEGWESPAITRQRHRQEIGAAAEALRRAEAQLGAGDIVLGAEEMRQTLRALGRLTGRVDVEELLDVIFRDFCIGK